MPVTSGNNWVVDASSECMFDCLPTWICGNDTPHNSEFMCVSHSADFAVFTTVIYSDSAVLKQTTVVSLAGLPHDGTFIQA